MPPTLYGVRDPHGFRPLCLGRLGPVDRPEGWVLASESPALDVIGATFVRELEPGRAGDDRRRRRAFRVAVRRRTEVAAPVHLRVRLLRPSGHPAVRPGGPRGAAADGRAAGRAGAGRRRPGHGGARLRCPGGRGVRPAQRHPLRPGAGQEPVHRPDVHQPGQQARGNGVRRKLNPLRENIAGKRLVVVDDSIVRGTTTRAIVRMLRDAGARRGPPADLLAAVPLALLLRDRHPDPRGAARRPPDARRDRAVPRGRLDRLHQPDEPEGGRSARRGPASATPA